MRHRLPDQPALGRRRLTLAGGWLLATGLSALAGCATGLRSAGMDSFTLTESQLNDWLTRSFPQARELAGLAELSFEAPSLRLLPEQNRLGTRLVLALREHITGQRFSGGMELDYGLRFDAGEGAIRMHDVRVSRLDIDQLPSLQQSLLARYAPRLAEHWLNERVLYRLPADRLAQARRQGLEVSALRVLPQGLRIELASPGGH